MCLKTFHFVGKNRIWTYSIGSLRKGSKNRKKQQKNQNFRLKSFHFLNCPTLNGVLRRVPIVCQMMLIRSDVKYVDIAYMQW